MILVYTTCANEGEAWKIGRNLLEGKLAACVVTFPVRSMYRWKGKIEDGSEYVLLIKTTKKNAKDVEKQVAHMHSYECPCIITIDAKANRAYEKWMESVLEGHETVIDLTSEWRAFEKRRKRGKR